MTNRTVWEVVLGEWDSVTANDLHQVYGIDVSLPETMRRPWWWLRSRIEGILDVPESRLVRRVAAKQVEIEAAEERAERAAEE